MTGSDERCVFCRIATGREQVETICEGEQWLAFFPINPATPGHTLVIPREHCSDLWELKDPLLAAELMHATIRVGRAIRTALEPDGMNLVTSAGETAEQTIFHLHLHLVPRWENDGFGKIWPTEHRIDLLGLGDVADRIRRVC